MKLAKKITTLRATLVLLLTVGSSVLAGQGSPRIVKRAPRVPLEQVIHSGETQIVVIDTDGNGHGVLAGDSLLEWSCHFTDTVVIMNIVSTQSTLTPNHDWVTSTFTAAIEQVVRPSAGISWLPSGQQFSFIQQGGTFQIGSTLVTAKNPAYRPLEVGKRYLTFMSIDSTTHEVKIARDWTYWIEADGTLHRHSAEKAAATPAEDDVEGRQLNEIVAAIPLVCS